MTLKLQDGDKPIDFAPLGFLDGSTGKSIDILKFVMSIRVPLAIGLGGGLLLGVLMYLFLGPTFEAKTRIMVSQKTVLPTNDRQANVVGERAEHVQLIMSDAVVRYAVERHGLKELPEFAGSSDPVYDVLDRLQAKRSAGQDTSFINLIDLTFTDPNPKTARTVVDAVVAGYGDYLRETGEANSSQLFQTLVERDKDLQQEIALAEQRHHKFREDSPYHMSTTPVVSVNGTVGPGRSPYETAVDRINQEQDALRSQQVDVESKIATLKELAAEGESRRQIEYLVTLWMSAGAAGTGAGAGSGGGGGNPVFTDSPVQTDLNARYLEMQLLLSRLTQQLGEDHDNVRKLRGQIDTLVAYYHEKGLIPPGVVVSDQPDEATNDEGGEKADDAAATPETGQVDVVAAYIRTLEHQVRGITTLLENKREQLAEAETIAKRASLFEVDDQKMKDEIEQLKEQRRQLVGQISSFDASRDQNGFRMQEISPVRVETSKKRMIKIIGACGALGLALVFGLSYFREWQDHSVRSIEDLRPLIGAPVIGSVPRFTLTAALQASAAATGIAPAIRSFHRPGSRDAEAYRSMRTSLFFALEGEAHKVIQVSSPEPGDGKSTTAGNFAVAVAQSGKRVLLVDADLRRPTIHTLFGLRHEIGLTESLQREIEWANAVQPTRLANLSVLTSGNCPANPAELLATPALGSLLREASREFDFVVVDTPPVLAVSDPSIVAPLTDGMLLVIRLGKNTRPIVRRTRETLDAHGVRLYGVVANDVDSSTEEGMSRDAYSTYYATEAAPASHSPAEATPTTV